MNETTQRIAADCGLDGEILESILVAEKHGDIPGLSQVGAIKYIGSLYRRVVALEEKLVAYQDQLEAEDGE